MNLEGRLERLHRDKLSSEVSEPAYRRFKAEWEGELASIESEVRALSPAHQATWDSSLAMMETVSNSADRFKEADSERRRAIFRELVSNSQLLDGKVTLELRPWFESLRERNEKGGLDVALEGQPQSWLPAMDSNHD